MRILGIDPGLAGGLAIVDLAPPGQIIAVSDIPVSGEKAKKRVDARKVREWIAPYMAMPGGVRVGYIERAQAMPRQGSSSGFIYGRGVGYLECLVIMLDIPLKVVEPSMWKKHFGLPGGADKKHWSVEKVKSLYPGCPDDFFARVMDHGRAEAALIAGYGFISNPPR